MPEEQRALLDHELMHCKHDEDGFYIADHDLEEFCEIVSRHGAWRLSISRFFQSGQGKLFTEGDDDVQDLKVKISVPGAEPVETTTKGLQRTADRFRAARMGG